MARKSRPYSESPKTSSTRSGCVIGLTMIGVITFLVGWGAYTFVRQNRAIDRFTTDTPLQLKLPRPDSEVSQELGRKLAAFAGAPPVTLELATADLNALVATTPELETVNGIVQFDAIGDGTVDATVSLPMRRLGSQDPRYLNGNVRFTPRAAEGQFFFDLVSMEATGAEIDTGFVTNYRNERYLDSLLLHPFQANTAVWPVLQSVTSVEVGDGVLVLERATPPGEPAGR